MADPIVSVAPSAHCFDVQFHPEENLFAAAIVTGEIELHRYDLEEKAAEKQKVLISHEDSCRTARFLVEGDSNANAGLASTSADCFAAVSDLEAGKRTWRGKLRAAGNALLPMGKHKMVVGDDDGGISFFDTRKKKATGTFSENSDFITDLALGTDGFSLCATAGDGTLAVYDIRKAGSAEGLIAMSDFQEDEFLSLAIMKHGTKVLCGSQTGVLAVFSWGDFGDHKDRIKGHPMSVDAIVKLTEDCILTGSSDGQIRVTSVYHQEFGNTILGIVGDQGAYPIERLALSPDGETVVCASHAVPAITLWSTERAYALLRGEEVGKSGEKDGDAADSSDDSDEPVAKKRRKGKKGKKKAPGGPSREKMQAGAFFSGL